MTSRRLPRRIIRIHIRLWERLNEVQSPQVVRIVATRWNCTLTDIGGSNKHLFQKMTSTVIRQQLMKMSFTFSVSKISELFWNSNKKFIIILGGMKKIIYPDGIIHHRGTLSVWLGRMTKLGLEWSKGPKLLYGGSYRSIVSRNQIYHIGGM